MIKSSEEIENCIVTLRYLATDAALLANLPEEQRIALLKVSGEISRPDRRERKKRNKTVDKTQRLAALEKDLRARNATGIRSARMDSTFRAPAQIASDSDRSEHKAERLHTPRNCYICT